MNKAAPLSSMNSHQKIPCLSALGVIWPSGAQWVRPTRPGSEEVPQLPLPNFQQRKVCAHTKGIEHFISRFLTSLRTVYSTHGIQAFLCKCDNNCFNGDCEDVQRSGPGWTCQRILHVFYRGKAGGRCQTSGTTKPANSASSDLPI